MGGSCHVVYFLMMEISDGCCHIIDLVIDIPISCTLVMDDGVMFSMVISIVKIVWICSFLSIYFEIELIFSASQPNVPHVPRFCFLKCDIIVDECSSDGIVGFNWSWRLRMTN